MLLKLDDIVVKTNWTMLLLKLDDIVVKTNWTMLLKLDDVVKTGRYSC